MSEIESYGVRERNRSNDAIGEACELLQIQGYCLLESGLREDELAGLREAFEHGLARYEERFGSRFDLGRLGETQTIRVLPMVAPKFFSLIENGPLNSILEKVFGDSVVLNQVNGLINPPASETYSQARWHRDLPYQHYVSTRPLAINALFCLDEFTEENGATIVAPGTHKQEKFPSDRVLRAISREITAPAGSFLVLDAMMFHAGGINRSDRARRAVNHVFTIPPIRQQICLETALEGCVDVPVHLKKLLGFGGMEARTVDEWFEVRTKRLAG